MKTYYLHFIFLSFITLLVCNGCNTSNDAGTVTDIDGNVYKTIQIGDQVWMAENLKVSHFRNGDPIPHSKSKIEWARYGEGIFSIYSQWAYPNFDVSNEEIYGKLYNWHAVNDPRGVAPKGWHIPSKDEWIKLADYLGKNAGKKMKSTNHWIATKYGFSPGSNKSCFNAVPSGGLSGVGSFGAFENKCFWWSSTTAGHINAWYFYLTSTSDVLTKNTDSQTSGNSIRCVKD
ncbi:MAG: fibrobacter succinogenes major paralogous domain-containing protein [Bacteroidales bacterium]|jgi:uncharacterized protein (TIGR02145 family)|nr:fibrobacter succinogenes major paralogous domain-containing protein [Bacteroidales bacterium]